VLGVVCIVGWIKYDTWRTTRKEAAEQAATQRAQQAWDRWLASLPTCKTVFTSSKDVNVGRIYILGEKRPLVVDQNDLTTDANYGSSVDFITPTGTLNDVPTATMFYPPTGTVGDIPQSRVAEAEAKGGFRLIQIEPIQPCKGQWAPAQENTEPAKPIKPARPFGNARVRADYALLWSETNDLLTSVGFPARVEVLGMQKDGDKYHVRLSNGRTGYMDKGDVELDSAR
jgi:hypothetical protein